MLSGAGVNGAVGTQGHGGGLAQGAAALPVTADQHGAAFGSAFGFNQGAAVEGDVVALHLHTASMGTGAVGAQHGVGAEQNRTFDGDLV